MKAAEYKKAVSELISKKTTHRNDKLNSKISESEYIKKFNSLSIFTPQFRK